MKISHYYARIFAAAVVVLAALVFVIPTFAAPGGTITGYSLDAANCTVDITAQVEDAGFYAINMWDDGNFRAGAGADVGAGATFTVRFTIGGVILQGAAGIGVYLEDAVGLAVLSTFDSNSSAQLWDDTVGLDCQARGFTFSATAYGLNGCSHPLPPGSVVYSVPDGALAFYAPDPNTYTGFNLPSGTWYISEFGEAYAKVWIACEADPIYIPLINVVR
jgi:hypothetical protein